MSFFFWGFWGFWVLCFGGLRGHSVFGKRGKGKESGEEVVFFIGAEKGGISIWGVNLWFFLFFYFSICCFGKIEGEGRWVDG